MKSRDLFLMPLMFIVFQHCQPAESSGDSVDHTLVDTTEITGRSALENQIQTAMFMERVALGSLMKDTLGKLAFERANNQAIKVFGKLMEQDHREINEALKVLSLAKGLKLPIVLPAKERRQVRQMREMEIAYFEKLYMKMMIEAHDKDIELFKGAGNSSDTAVSNFVRKFLPVLQMHREKAIKVNARIK